MNPARIAIWILGPIGSGKSTFLARHVPAPFRVLDQDLELEAELRARQIPMDTRKHSEVQTSQFIALRKEVTDRLWCQVPIWRAQGLPMAFQSTGNKPHLLQKEIEANRAAGYRDLGIGLHQSLATCLAGNQSRERVLPADVVESTWLDFENNLALHTYESIFGKDAWHVIEANNAFDLASELRKLS